MNQHGWFHGCIICLVLRVSFGVVPPFGRMRLTEGVKRAAHHPKDEMLAGTSLF